MQIVHLGNALLRQKSVPVQEVNQEIKDLIPQMFDAMHKADGVGLAAVQVGKLLRIFVVEINDGLQRVFINPQIIETSCECVTKEEGCLSVPNTYEDITRPERIRVQALNLKGRPFTIEADGLLARVIQHEYDHLEGILFIDRGDADVRAKTEALFEKQTEKKQ